MNVDLTIKIITLCISILTLCGFGVVMKFFWEDKHRKKMEQTEEAKKAQKSKRQAEMREVLEPFEKKLNVIENDLKDTKNGIQAELRHDIRNACRRCIHQHYKTLEDLEEVTTMHENYERLGSNGKTNALYDEFMKLPTHEKEEVVHETSKAKTRKKGGAVKNGN